MVEAEGACKEAGTYTPINVLCAVLVYMACSAGMSIANKIAVDGFKLACTLTLFQMLFTLTFCLTPWVWRKIYIKSWWDIWRFLPTCIGFGLLLFTSMKAYSYNTLATIVVFRNLSPLLVLPMESMFRYPVQWNLETVLCLMTILAGVLLYAAKQMSVSFEGVAWILVNLVSACFDRLYFRYIMAQEPVAINDTGMMLLNNIGGIGPVLIAVLAFGEHREFVSTVQTASALTWCYIALSCIVGLGICFCGIRLARRVSATSFMVCSNVSKVWVIAFGIFVLSEQFNVGSAIGCAISMCGGIWYGANRNSMKKQQAAKDVEQAVSEPKLNGPAKVAAASASDKDGDEQEPLLGTRRGNAVEGNVKAA